MTPRSNGSPSAARSETSRLLLEAAAAEFNECGYHGTDSNKIARRAGFAPQTFYRSFESKLRAFTAVYAWWQDDERRRIEAAIRPDADDAENRLAVAAALVASHRTWRVFRRSLRLLAVQDDEVRAARARGRRSQLAAILGTDAPPSAAHVAALLSVERYCDAMADDECRDLGIADGDWLATIADALTRLR